MAVVLGVKHAFNSQGGFKEGRAFSDLLIRALHSSSLFPSPFHKNTLGRNKHVYQSMRKLILLGTTALQGQTTCLCKAQMQGIAVTALLCLLSPASGTRSPQPLNVEVSFQLPWFTSVDRSVLCEFVR